MAAYPGYTAKPARSITATPARKLFENLADAIATCQNVTNNETAITSRTAFHIGTIVSLTAYPQAFNMLISTSNIHPIVIELSDRSDQRLSHFGRPFNLKTERSKTEIMHDDRMTANIVQTGNSKYIITGVAQIRPKVGK
jgi:hypothetical protein